MMSYRGVTNSGDEVKWQNPNPMYREISTINQSYCSCKTNLADYELRRINIHGENNGMFLQMRSSWAIGGKAGG